MEESQFPLGVVKQATMKLDAYILDLREILEDDEVNDKDKENIQSMIDLSSNMMANLVNMVRNNIGEEELLKEEIDMDEIDPFPEPFSDVDLEPDILDEEVDV